MHKIVAGALALPALTQTYVSTLTSRLVRQSAPRKLAALSLIGVIVVGGVVTGAAALGPTKDPGGRPSGTTSGNTDIAMNAAFQVHFTTPMDQASVSASVSIQPPVAYKKIWDGSGRILSLEPETVWAPYTYYIIVVGAEARDQTGRSMGEPIQSGFETGSRTTGQITATVLVGAQVAPTTAFKISFSRPVKLSTVILKTVITPLIPVTISGDDPADQASRVFTITPKAVLTQGQTYLVKFLNEGATDSSESSVGPLTDLKAVVIPAPKVVRFRPFDRGYAYDPNQPVSVRFTTPMDPVATAAAFSVMAGDKVVTGDTYWVENNTVLVLIPGTKFLPGQKVVARVAKGAKSFDGRAMLAAASSSFTIARPEVKNIPWTGGAASSRSPWHASELYYLRLMNCTRTGGWVISSGRCSSASHHVMPAQDALKLDKGISDLVARPYAKYMADHKLLDHYLNGTNPHYRLSAQGWDGRSWGENIGSPSSSGQGGMVQLNTFYQDEYKCRQKSCEFGHYFNIMAPYFDRAGIGVWVGAKTHATRVVIDFYG